MNHNQPSSARSMPSKRWASPCSSSSSKKGAGTRPSSTQTSGGKPVSSACRCAGTSEGQLSAIAYQTLLLPARWAQSVCRSKSPESSWGRTNAKAGAADCSQGQLIIWALVTSRRSAAGKEVCSISAASMWRRSQGCQRARMAALYRAWRSSTVSLASKSLAA